MHHTLRVGDEHKRQATIGSHNDHNSDVIMIGMASQITSLVIVYSTAYSGADKKNHQSFASLAFVREFTGDRWIPRTKGQ